jgi:hypothetical protein
MFRPKARPEPLCVGLYFVIVCKSDSSVSAQNFASVHTRMSPRFLCGSISEPKNDRHLFASRVVISSLDRLATCRSIP